MIDFSRYTREAIQKEMLDQVDPSIDTREGSMVQTSLGPTAWYLEGTYMALDQIQKNAYPATAVGASLDMIVQTRGLTRKQATAAVRKGTFNTAVPSGAEFKTINGADSQIFVVGEKISGSGTEYVYKMKCSDAGFSGNNYVGNLLPITAVDGLISAVLGDIITAGTEEETDDALRSRFYETFNVAAFGGNLSSYRNEILAIEGVGAVQVYPAWKGGGTVLCSILGDDLRPACAHGGNPCNRGQYGPKEEGCRQRRHPVHLQPHVCISSHPDRADCRRIELLPSFVPGAHRRVHPNDRDRLREV